MATELPGTDSLHYQAAGSLVRPLLLGRLVRLVLGLLCLSLAWDLLGATNPAAVNSPEWWILVVLGLVLVNYIVNLGFSLSLRSAPLLVSLSLFAAAALYSQVSTGSPLDQPLFAVTRWWLIYLFTHLGLSFLIASVIATPGCEMRAIPHLLGTMRRVDVSEHACPAFIDKLDNWEYRWRGGEKPDEKNGAALNENDLLARPGSYVLVYGVPIIAVQLAGNLGGFTIATAVPALAFLAVALLSFVNVYRCRRVHSMLIGPLALVAGTMMGLYSLGLFSLGGGTWAIIVNGALILGICFSIKLEILFGRYAGSGSANNTPGN